MSDADTMVPASFFLISGGQFPMALSRALADRLRFVAEAKKTFDARPRWDLISDRRSQRLALIVALKLDGLPWRGVFLRMYTPRDVWEEDVYGQIDVRPPGMNRSLRLNPVEWRPPRHHDNPRLALEAHSNQRLFDRWHPFELNVDHGMQSFDQSGAGIAVPLPRAPSSFREYADLCSELWICPDLLDISPPPWSRKML